MKYFLNKNENNFMHPGGCLNDRIFCSIVFEVAKIGVNVFKILNGVPIKFCQQRSK